jgi:hypothetical protein
MHFDVIILRSLFLIFVRTVVPDILSIQMHIINTHVPAYFFYEYTVQYSALALMRFVIQFRVASSYLAQQCTYIPRLPQCLSPRLNRDPPPPLPQASVSLPPEPNGGGDILACR